MAAKGRILDHIGRYFWHYRKLQPQNLQYTVTYFPSASIFDVEPSAAQQTYCDFCAKDGWQLVATSGVMQVFCNENPDAVPIETDEQQKLDIIKSAFHKKIGGTHVLLAVLMVIQLWMQYQLFSANPVDWFANPAQFAMPMLFLTCLFYSSYQVFDYFHWFSQSSKAVAQGGVCLKNNSKRRRLGDRIYLTTIIVWFFLMILGMGALDRPVILVAICIPILYVFAFHGALKLVKKFKKSRNFNRAFVIIAYIIAVITVMGSVTYLLVSGSVTSTRAVRTIEYHSINIDIYADEIPLTTQQLYGAPLHEYYSTEANVTSSFLLTQAEYTQVEWATDATLPELNYTIWATPYDWLYDLCLTQAIAVPNWAETRFTQQDSTIWNANLLYVEPYSNTYVACYNDCILSIQLEDAPTAEQVEIIINALICT